MAIFEVDFIFCCLWHLWIQIFYLEEKFWICMFLFTEDTLNRRLILTILNRTNQCSFVVLIIWSMWCILILLIVCIITNLYFIDWLWTIALILRKSAIHVIGKALRDFWSIFHNLLYKIRIDFVKFSKDAICPTKGMADAAGFDLYSVEDVIIQPSTVKLIRTDIGFKFQEVILARYVLDLVLPYGVQMLVVEWLMRTIEVQSPLSLFFQQICWGWEGH